jgi:tRNA threonylcarbamoyladenosine modification (KEOPS) complex  Pcc1 subunit
MEAKAAVRLKFPSEKNLLVTCNALLPETSRPGSKRAHVTIEMEGTFLVLKVEAENSVALRSTLNAYLRWIASTKNILEVLGANSRVG